MRVAIVHDALVEFGGAERVLQAFIKLYKEADIFTLFADKDIVEKHFSSLSRNKIHTLGTLCSTIGKHTTIFQYVSPLLWSFFDFSSYDLVISSASYLMSGLVSISRGIHVIYIHSPPKNLVGLLAETSLQKVIPLTPFINWLYKRNIQKAMTICVNSEFMKRIIDKEYAVNSTVVYPPVHIPPYMRESGKRDIYLFVSRLDREKYIELAIKACNYLRVPLVIIGKTNENRYEKFLRLLSGPTIYFAGYVPDNELSGYYFRAKAVIFTAKKEDFGIVPVEAMAHGTPVIAYYGGGVRETIIDGITGTFFYKHSVASLIEAIDIHNRRKFAASVLYKQAKKFSEYVFRKKFVRIIASF